MLRRSHVRIESPDGVGVVERRLHDACESSAWSMVMGLQKGVSGRASSLGRAFTFTRNRGRGNSFRPYLRVHVEEAGDGAAVTGAVGPHPGVQVFMLVWMVGLVAFWAVLVTMVAGDVRDGSGLEPQLLLLAAVPVFMLGSGVFIVWFGKRQSGTDDYRLIARVCQIVDGTIVEPLDLAMTRPVRPRRADSSDIGHAKSAAWALVVHGGAFSLVAFPTPLLLATRLPDLWWIMPATGLVAFGWTSLTLLKFLSASDGPAGSSWDLSGAFEFGRTWSLLAGRDGKALVQGTLGAGWVIVQRALLAMALGGLVWWMVAVATLLD